VRTIGHGTSQARGMSLFLTINADDPRVLPSVCYASSESEAHVRVCKASRRSSPHVLAASRNFSLKDCFGELHFQSMPTLTAKECSISELIRRRGQ